MPGRVTAMELHEVETRLQHLERLLAGLPAEANALWDDLQAVKKHLLQREDAIVQLDRETSLLRQELGHLGEELGASQRRSLGAAEQLIAIARLQSTLDRGRMLQALEEIVGSLVGCEEMAVFELVGAPATLELVRGTGVAPDSFAELALPDGVIFKSATSGGMWIAEHRGACDRSAPRLTVSVPLEVDGRGVGALALFRLLEHKPLLDQRDIELLDLLRVHLGVALVSTRELALPEPS